MKLFGSLDKYLISIGLVLFVVASVAYAYGQSVNVTGEAEERALYMKKLGSVLLDRTCDKYHDPNKENSSLQSEQWHNCLDELFKKYGVK
jgi:hypothetical protein